MALLSKQNKKTFLDTLWIYPYLMLYTLQLCDRLVYGRTSHDFTNLLFFPGSRSMIWVIWRFTFFLFIYICWSLGAT
jgi:hypothetical protein